MAKDDTVSHVEPVERDGAEVDGPDAVGHLFEADELTTEQVLPIALRLFPTEYPLPWIVVGGLGWIFTCTVRRLFPTDSGAESA